jgi:hypothetical protein
LYQEIAELFPGKLKLTSEKQKKGNYIQIKRIQENEEDEEDSTLTHWSQFIFRCCSYLPQVVETTSKYIK